jgi:ABC-type nitrate/sulfonate/bicarbonate transport system substrate-binding protein
MRTPSARRTKAAALSAAMTVAALALAACGGSSGGAGSGTASGPVPTITLGSPGIPPVISGLLPYVAQKEGFYRKSWPPRASRWWGSRARRSRTGWWPRPTRR